MSSPEQTPEEPTTPLECIQKIHEILEEAASRPPHVCEDGCRCRQAYRRALAKALGGYSP